MGARMTAAARDQKLVERVDAGASESDRLFFRQQPSRNFRLRPAWTDEIELFARQGSITGTPAADCCWWVLVHQLVKDTVRVRWPVVGPLGAMPDPPENVAQHVWKLVVPPDVREQARTLRRDIKQILDRYPQGARA
jgi:hypothetical protein